MQPNTGSYDEYLSYDVNGNIKTLSRFGDMDKPQAVKIDELSYTYIGNQLVKVSDNSQNPSGYPIGGGVIPYDENGNMMNHNDKGISYIGYNHLNLPSAVFWNGKQTFYLYRADGVKVKKDFPGKVTDYLDGFQYENGALQFVPTAEGYYDFVKQRYVYNYTDHLGNIRLSYYKGTGGLIVDKESNYYPFGLEHKGYNNSAGNSAYRYSYQGQERQEDTNWLAFKWRNYDPTIGRFFGVDPLSENFPYNSTYAIQENKMGLGREFEGLELVLTHGTNAKRDDTKLYSVILADYQGGSTWQKDFSQKLASATGWSPKSTYEYSWSGKNNVPERKMAGEKLAKWLMSDANPYKDLKHATLVGHSHGGNGNKITKNILEANGWEVDIINIATPQREDFQSDRKGEGLYINFYNNSDIIQVLGKIGDGSNDGTGRYTSSHKKARIDNNAKINAEVSFIKDWFQITFGHSYHQEVNAQNQMIKIVEQEIEKKK